MTSFLVTWWPPTASYSPEEVKCTVYASSQPSTATSRWLPVKWRHFRFTFGHLRSRDLISCHVTPSYCKLQPCRKWNVEYASFRPSTSLPGDFLSNDVTSGSLGHLKSHDIISCHVTASYCELQPCRKWNVQNMQVSSLLQPLPGNFRSNDVTSGSLPVNWGCVTSLPVTWQVISGQMTSLPVTRCHVTFFPATWLPHSASYSLVGSKTCSIHEFRPFTDTSRWLLVKWRHFRVTSGYLRSRDFISCHTIASYCELPPCRKWNVHNTPVFGLLQPLPDDFQSNYITFNHQRLWVISCHVTATYCELQPCRSIMCSIRDFWSSTATSRDFRSKKVTSSDLRSHDVISCHVSAS